LVIATRRLCRRFIEANKEKTNVDAIIGKDAYVTEEIDNLQGLGEVKVGGLAWSARSQDGEKIAVGTLVTVLEVQGVKLIVTPKETK
jgi:membrane protein implicated in regulation of membrane protease activity